MVFTKETKTISARIPEDVHADILDRCNREGCTVNHFLNCAIELAITGYSDFEFGDEDQDEEEKEPPASTPAKRVVISLSPKDNQEDRCCSHSS